MIASLPFGRRASRLIERNLLVYRRGWIIIFSGFFEPFFYLLGTRVSVYREVSELLAYWSVIRSHCGAAVDPLFQCAVDAFVV